MASSGGWRLRACDLKAFVYTVGGVVRWDIGDGAYHDDAPTLEAAQLAAEDALRAVLVEAAAALGLRVVP
jgi:hypothetical protein